MELPLVGDGYADRSVAIVYLHVRCDEVEIGIVSRQAIQETPEDSGCEFYCARDDHTESNWMLVFLGEAMEFCHGLRELLTRPELALTEGCGAYRDPETGKWIVEELAE